MENKLCPVCQAPMQYKEPKQGQRWKAFWGCKNYKDEEHIKAKQSKTDAGFQMIMESLVALNNRIDSMATYLKSKLGEPERIKKTIAEQIKEQDEIPVVEDKINVKDIKF